MIVQGQLAITDYRHFDNAPIVRSARVATLPVLPAALHWPGDKTDAEVERTLSDNGNVAFNVIQRGVVVYECYFNGYARDSMLTSSSMAKAVISSLLGIEIAEGRIASVDDPVTRYLPGLRRIDPRFDAVTLRHLLAMRGGIAFDENCRWPFSGAARFYLSDDLGASTAARSCPPRGLLTAPPRGRWPGSTTPPGATSNARPRRTRRSKPGSGAARPPTQRPASIPSTACPALTSTLKVCTVKFSTSRPSRRRSCCGSATAGARSTDRCGCAGSLTTTPKQRAVSNARSAAQPLP